MAIENLEFPTWSSRTKENVLNGRIYNGRIGFSVFPLDRSMGSKPLASVAFDQKLHGYTAIMEIIQEVQKSPLGTKIPMSKTKWNPQTKQVSNEWILTIEKDSEMMYWITVSDCVLNQSYRFPITASRNILIGNDPASNAGQSSMGLKMFVNWLQLAAKYAPMTATKMQRGAPGSGNYQQNRGSAPPVPTGVAVSPQVAGDSENLPF